MTQSFLFTGNCSDFDVIYLFHVIVFGLSISTCLRLTWTYKIAGTSTCKINWKLKRYQLLQTSSIAKIYNMKSVLVISFVLFVLTVVSWNKKFLNFECWIIYESSLFFSPSIAARVATKTCMYEVYIIGISTRIQANVLQFSYFLVRI